MHCSFAVADPEILKGEDNVSVSAPSSFVANAHMNYMPFIRERITN